MKLERTTLRIKENLIRGAKREALEQETSLQEVVNNALWHYLKRSRALKPGRKIVALHPRDLGPLDNLTRDDIYE